MLSDRLMEIFGGRSWSKRQAAKAMRRLRLILEEGRARGGAPRSRPDNWRPTIRVRLVRSRRLWILICLVAAAVGLSAVRQGGAPEVADADNDGVYVDAGPITYQLQISRELNPYSVED